MFCKTNSSDFVDQSPSQVLMEDKSATAFSVKYFKKGSVGSFITTIHSRRGQEDSYRKPHFDHYRVIHQRQKSNSRRVWNLLLIKCYDLVSRRIGCVNPKKEEEQYLVKIGGYCNRLQIIVATQVAGRVTSPELIESFCLVA